VFLRVPSSPTDRKRALLKSLTASKRALPKSPTASKTALLKSLAWSFFLESFLLLSRVSSSKAFMLRCRFCSTHLPSISLSLRFLRAHLLLLGLFSCSQDSFAALGPGLLRVRHLMLTPCPPQPPTPNPITPKPQPRVAGPGAAPAAPPARSIYMNVDIRLFCGWCSGLFWHTCSAACALARASRVSNLSSSPFFFAIEMRSASLLGTAAALLSGAAVSAIVRKSEDERDTQSARPRLCRAPPCLQ